MAQPDHFDPTRVLDGWQAPAPWPVDPVVEFSALHKPQRPGPVAIDAALAAALLQPSMSDPAHALDGWRPPTPAPLDLELKSLPRAACARPGDAKKAWLKSRGYEMAEVEDVEVSQTWPGAAPAPASPQPRRGDVAADRLPAAVADPLWGIENAGLPPAPLPPMAEAAILDLRIRPPTAADPQQGVDRVELPKLQPTGADPSRVIREVSLPEPVAPPAAEAAVLDFRPPPPPAPVDPRKLIAEVGLPEVSPPAVVRAPVLDIPRVHRPAVRDPRLIARWQPGAWTALARRVRAGVTEVVQAPNGPLVTTRTAQWLCALWRPQGADAPLLDRWPECAGLVGAETVCGALHQLLAELPPRAQVWSAHLDADWALVAELVLHQDGGLDPRQAQALRELIAAERHASLARFNDRYAASSGVVRRRA